MSNTSVVQALSDMQKEASRQMVVCNACRYCEGLCAVFPAMESRPQLTAGDIDFLSNVCHGCGACFYDCQYAPPHEFSINIPEVLAEIRDDSYARYAWPGTASKLFKNNGVFLTLALFVAVTLFTIGFAVRSEPTALFAQGSEAGAFYRVMPHPIMVLVFGGAFLFSVAAMSVSLARFWRATGPPSKWSWYSAWRATRDAGLLRYLNGGGMGCMNENERPSNHRRLYHHAAAGGFLLCFASTVSGTFAHYLFNWQAPYPWWSPTVLLGPIGGVGLIVGPIGLLLEKHKRDPAIRRPQHSGMDSAFIWTLLLVSITGFILLVLRNTSAMGLLLAVHLGCVFAMFVSLPYSKFMHGLYRYAALVRYEHDRYQANNR